MTVSRAGKKVSNAWTLRAEGSTLGMVADAEEVRRALKLFADPTSGCQLLGLTKNREGRVIGIPKTLAGSNIDGLCEAAASLPSGSGIYYRINPVPENLSRSANAGDVFKRRWVYIDIDPVKPDEQKDDPATDNEKDGTISVCDAVNDYLQDIGWPAPVIVDSGNGHGLHYPCDLPNDQDTQDRIRDLLKVLAAKFSGPKGKVDKSVHNADRLAKLPGTWARKGTEYHDRPYRPAKLVFVPQSLGCVTLAQLPEKNAIPQPSKNGKHREPFKCRATTGDGDTAYAQAALEGECSRVVLAKPGPDEGRNNALFRAACNLGELVNGGVLDRSVVTQRLTDSAFRTGLDAHEIASCIASGFKKVEGKSRNIPENQKPLEEKRWSIPVEPKRNKDDAEIYPLPDLLAMELPAPRWAIPGLLSEGLTILAGKPKLGKSWMALNLAMTVAAGGMALGSIKVHPGDVLYLALEDRLRRIRDRAAKVLGGLKLQAPGRLGIAVEWKRQDKGGVFDLAKWLAQANDPRLIVIDVWAKFRSPAKMKGSAYEQDYDQLTEVKSVADHYGASVLAIHHTRKGAAEDVFDEISGTLGIAGAADGSMVLTRSRGKNEGTLAMTGRDIEEQTIAVEFDPNAFTWRSLGSAEDRVGGELQKRVLAYLKLMNGRAVFTSDIAEHLEESQDKVRPTLHKLLEKLIIKHVGNTWSYPGEGDEIPT
jgi:hypothetical protein